MYMNHDTSFLGSALLTHPAFGVVQELLFEARGQVSGQLGRAVEQNNEALAAEASLACSSLALVGQSQGTHVHLAACWNADKKKIFNRSWIPYEQQF